MKRLAVCLLAVLLAGCVNLDKVTERPATTVYVLRDGGSVAPAAATDPRSLLVFDSAVDAFLDSEAMAYSRAPGTLARYQFARWSALPGKRFADLLRRRLNDSRAFATVARAGGPVRGDLLLDTRLVAFHHDAADAPGMAVVVVEAELVDLKQHTLLARERVEIREPAASHDAVGAARAFDRATGRVLDRLQAWLASAPE